MEFKFLPFFLLLRSHGIHGRTNDYFSGSFDRNKNCLKEELMKNLTKESYPRCAAVVGGDEDVQWEKCKKKLAEIMSLKCRGFGTSKKQETLYCRRRGITKCCYLGEKCKLTPYVGDRELWHRSLKFLANDDTVKEYGYDLGYDTCRKTKGYQASPCHKDCRRLEKSDFAKKCSKDGGLFKCCIRRDAEFCHECRFCCTLSVCTDSSGNSKFLFTNESLNEAKSEGSSGEMDAGIGFLTDQPMYKNSDFRCLKPKSGVKSSKWPHYEMKGFRASKNNKELSNVKEIPFDKYFLNFEDPEVFNAITDGTEKGLGIWKKTYGFDWADYVPGRGKVTHHFKCNEHCLKAEFGSFAEKCRKEGGLFKCCTTLYNLSQFHYIRYQLKKAGYITNGPKNITCGNDFTKGHCYICSATHACSKKDPLTGLIKQEFKTPYTLPQTIGGWTPDMGIKFSGCHVMNSCGKRDKYNSIREYKEASTKSEFCNLHVLWNWSADMKPEETMRNETYQKSFYDVCMKSRHPSSIICPYNDIFKPINMVYAEATNALRILERNLTLTEMKIKSQRLKKRLSRSLKKHKKTKRKAQRKRKKVNRMWRPQQKRQKKRKLRRKQKRSSWN